MRAANKITKKKNAKMNQTARIRSNVIFQRATHQTTAMDEFVFDDQCCATN